MNKLLKLTGVSMLAIVAATGANAAGYTCEELIEYTSCSPGYYLNSSTACPDEYAFRAGVCIADLFFYSGTSDGVCQNDMDGNYLGDRCVLGHIEEGDDVTSWWQGEFDDYGELFADLSSAADCVTCPAGSTCAGGTADAEECPAGSYCEGAGLSAVSGKCALGSYSTGGVTSCTSCPSTGLTDKDGKTVVATTAATGSTSASACFVGQNWYFQDTKGVWHFKSNCNAFDASTATKAEKQARCESFGGEFVYEDDGMDNYVEYCENYNFTEPTTEDACSAIEFCYWHDNDMDYGCQCECIGSWLFDLETGVTYCDETI